MYKNSVAQFNANKTAENRELLHLKKKDYKYHCRKVKMNYNRKMASNLIELRNKKPKDFWKIFSKKKTNRIDNNLGMEEFYNHFKKLTSEFSIEEDNEIEYFFE